MEKLFKIVKDNKKSLREKSIDIKLPLNGEINQLGLDMLNYLKLSQDEEFLKTHKDVREGVGLAAPQIGRNIKLIAIYLQDLNHNNQLITKQFILVNPKIVQESAKKCYLRQGEGCLSVDKKHEGYVYRANKVTVEAYSILDQKPITITASGYLSIVLQHEIDHLYGILYYDRINSFEPFKVDSNAVAIE